MNALPTTIIPTPRHCERLPGGGRSWRAGGTVRLIVEGDGHAASEFAVQFLSKRLREGFGLRAHVVAAHDARAVRADDVLLCGYGAARIVREEETEISFYRKERRRTQSTADTRRTNDDPLAVEQGYVIEARAGEPVVLCAGTPTGLLYAAATFLQLLTRNGDNVELLNVAIQDYPEYRWRGNSWLLHGERHGWSYGRGDGPRAYEQRIIRKLDLCAMHKVNFLHFHGFDWDVEAFPGYGAMMRRLNAEAKLRGVRLSYGGEGAFQGGFTNRKRYPNGAEYPCVGYPNDEKSRLAGTCLSNRALLKLRQATMEKFVRGIHPGAIYLHNIDTGTIAESAPIWNLRCPECRKRWPNDAIIAPDGMAGAYAAFYDEMAATIHRIDPDCLLTVVSPVYTGWDESDKDWEQACRYWVTVSRCLRDGAIQFGLREQFMNLGDGRARFADLRRRLDRDANDHRISALLFYGGDNFYNGHPFLAAPIVSSHFRGADLVVSGNGTAYQEPQQLLTAECLWNPRGSRYFTPPKRESFVELRKRFLRLSNGIDRPRGIWGPGGFLGDACNQLYGPKAGPLVARMYRLRGKTHLGSPVFARNERTFIWTQAFHYLHPIIYSRAFRHCGVVWRKDRDRKQQALSRRLAAVYRETSRLNREAATLARRASHLCADPNAAADLAWMADALDAARRCADLLGPFVEMFIRAHRAAKTGRATARALAEVKAFTRRAAAFDRSEKRKLPKRIMPAELELMARQNTGARLERLLGAMRETLGMGRWA